MKDAPLVGVVRGRWSQAVPRALLEACSAAGVEARELAADGLRVVVESAGATRVPGAEGVTHLAPAVVHRQPCAQIVLAALERGGARALNPAAAAAIADDKAATAVALAGAGVAQVRTVVTSQDPHAVAQDAARIGYPLVVKRTHGAQGRWVRRVSDPDQLPQALDELAEDGVSALVLQPFVAVSGGRTIRVIVTGGRMLAATERMADPADFRTNVHLGGQQRAIDVSAAQRALAVGAAAALGLGHAGVDLIETEDGSAVLEVNACPDFTSMRAHTSTDIAAAVIAELVHLG
ncbi:MAG: RimK family alpha-L-glutamate ligase [Candidatus Nanopelagicales bacterium]